MIYGVAEPTNNFPVAIMAWSIKEVVWGESEQPTRHLIGHIPQISSGRTTSAIQSFDREKMQITTRSGRVYALLGHPGENDDADYVWERWKAFNHVRNEKDVTNEYDERANT
ncbi:hypothetical protein [Methylobacter sp.]|uniref:hypothetical protein n=1 Tax=Methylobacter sp. TaxID=2051955 RepID=UPI002FDE5061